MSKTVLRVVELTGVLNGEDEYDFYQGMKNVVNYGCPNCTRSLLDCKDIHNQDEEPAVELTCHDGCGKKAKLVKDETDEREYYRYKDVAEYYSYEAS